MLGLRSLSFTLFQLALLSVPVYADTESDCRVPGDPDILGLGVRLGLYFQLSSTWILQLVRREEAVDTFLPTAFFITSYFIAFVFSTARDDVAPGAVIACTWYPVLFLVALFSFDFRALEEKKKITRYSLAYALFLASGVLNIWFWFKGLDEVNGDQCMEPRVFFFANLNAKGGVRVLFRILALIFVIGLLALVIVEFLQPDPERPKTRDEESAERATGRSSTSGKAIPTMAQSPSPKSAQGSDLTRAAELEKQESPDERNHGSITTGSVVPNILSPTTTPPGLADDSTTKNETSVEIESISPISPIPSPKDTTAEKTDTSTLVPAEISTSPVPTPLLVSPQKKSRKTDEGPDNLDWNTALGSVFIFLVVYILPAELQLRWNHLSGINSVNTTGQIIPLALGSLSLFRSIYLLKDANWSRLTKEQVEEGIKKLEKRLTMQAVDESPPAQDLKLS